MNSQNIKAEVRIAVAFGFIALIALFAVAIFFPHPGPLLVTIARVTLALACAGIAAVIPGLLTIELRPTVANIVRAGGALAVFVLVYFFSPAGLITSPDEPDPGPTTDYMSEVAEWVKLIDVGSYFEAYERASAKTRLEYTPELFSNIYKSYLAPLGKVKTRVLVGGNSAVQLPNGERGQFRIINYKVNFEKGIEQIETIVLVAENDTWKIRNHTYSPMPGAIH